jgi:signal transduction histidine kinase
MKILVVDDEFVSRMTLQKIMRSIGECEAVENGEEALKVAFSDQPPDLILLDIMMPGMDGYTVCKRLRADPSTKDTPIIFLSANTKVEDITKGFELGAVDYITKPFQKAEVKARVRTHLALKQMREEAQDKNFLLNKQVYEIKEKTERLDQSRKQLVQSEKMASLGQLVAGVAHEINTPVGIGITVSSHLVDQTREIISAFDKNKMTKSALTQYFGKTLETSELIFTHLVQAGDLVRSFKMISADQTVHERRSFMLKTYLDDIIVSLRPKLKKELHQVTLNCREDIEINSYPGALAQIITNLIINSLLHAYEEGEEGNIRIDVSTEESEVILEYSDDGKGIPPENIEKVFDPFFTTKRGEGGTGLGLHIIYNTVTEILKGSISCESTLGQGTRFSIKLPISIAG